MSHSAMSFLGRLFFIGKLFLFSGLTAYYYHPLMNSTIGSERQSINVYITKMGEIEMNDWHFRAIFCSFVYFTMFCFAFERLYWEICQTRNFICIHNNIKHEAVIKNASHGVNSSLLNHLHNIYRFPKFMCIVMPFLVRKKKQFLTQIFFQFLAQMMHWRLCLWWYIHSCKFSLSGSFKCTPWSIVWNGDLYWVYFSAKTIF